MSEITLCESNSNFEMEKTNMTNKTCFMEEPLNLNENCIYPGSSKTEFCNLSPKEKAIALYTPNNTKDKSNKIVKLENEKYSHSHWSKSKNINSNSMYQTNEILNNLACSLKLYQNDISFMIEDLFNSKENEFLINDIEDFFKYSLIIGKNECSISEKILGTIHNLSKQLIEKTKENKKLHEQVINSSINIANNNISTIKNNEFCESCLVQLEDLTEQLSIYKTYYNCQINDLLDEINQRDDLLDYYQKRENYLFNYYYPKLIEKSKHNEKVFETQNKEDIINELSQQLSEIEFAFKEELDMKNNLIKEINAQKDAVEKYYKEKLHAKEKELLKSSQKYQLEIERYKNRSAAQVKLAEQIKSQIHSQQIEYCKKIEDMQQNLDSRGKIIAYVQNKLNIRENELKIANIKFTTAERQMNIEKEQYKREISNLKEELEKTNEDIDELENELDTLEENLTSDHKDELARLEKEHDFQLNKLWNIIDQRENTINKMEDQMDELREKNENLEKTLSKYEVNDENESEGRVINEEVVEDVNERSNITMTGDTSEEIIIINDDYSDNSKFSELNSSNILTSELIGDNDELINIEKTELTNAEENDETNSLTLTEDLSENSSEDRDAFEEEEEGNEYDLENEMRLVNEENENLKRQLDLIKNDNSNLKSQLQQEKDIIKKENEKYTIQKEEYEELTNQYSQVVNENKEIKNKLNSLISENKERKEQEQKMRDELELTINQQTIKFQKEKEEFESRLEILEKDLRNSISIDQYSHLQKELEVTIENLNEQRRKKNYLKQKLSNQHEKNKVLVELIKKERAQSKEEIRQLKQSCVKQNGKIKAILKQVKDGLVTTDHIDLDRIVKRMKSERLLMSNEYERLKKVASSLSIKSASKKQSFGIKNEGLNDLSLNYKSSKKDINRSEGSISIKSRKPLKQNSENKILIKVSPGFEPLQDESLLSKQANDSLNSIESIEEDQQELEEFSLKKALSQHSTIDYPEEDDDDQNSFVDFTISPGEKKEVDRELDSKDSISLILSDNTNKMTQQQINLYSRILQIPGVVSINANGTRRYEFDDTNFSITSENSIIREGEGYNDKRGIGLEVVSPNRIRYNSYNKNEFKNNNHASLRRMPNFDQIGKLTQIKIKHSAEEITV